MKDANFTALRIRQAREELGLSQEELGRRYGSTAANISQIERGVRTVGINSLRRLALILDKPVDFFLSKDAKPYSRPPEAALSDLEVSIRAYIPVYGEVSAGPGIEPIDYVACSRLKPAPDTYRAFRVKGLCLEPEIKDGDTLIVDTALSPQNDDLVVVIIDGQASVKTYHDTGTDKWLENHFGKYRPEDVHMIGVVVEFNRRRR